MKRILIVILAALALSSYYASAQDVKKAQGLKDRETICEYVDLSVYADADFLFTPNEYKGDYAPLGMIYFIVDPAVVKKSMPSKYGYSGGSSTVTESETISYQEFADMVFKKATAMGGDAITNFQIEKREWVFGDANQYSPVRPRVYYKYYVQGFCIKRK